MKLLSYKSIIRKWPTNLFTYLINLLVRDSDKRIANDGEYSDSEDEGEGRRDEKSHKSPRKKVRQGSPVTSMVSDATANAGTAAVPAATKSETDAVDATTTKSQNGAAKTSEETTESATTSKEE